MRIKKVIIALGLVGTFCGQTAFAVTTAGIFQKPFNEARTWPLGVGCNSVGYIPYGDPYSSQYYMEYY